MDEVSSCPKLRWRALFPINADLVTFGWTHASDGRSESDYELARSEAALGV